MCKIRVVKSGWEKRAKAVQFSMVERKVLLLLLLLLFLLLLLLVQDYFVIWQDLRPMARGRASLEGLLLALSSCVVCFCMCCFPFYAFVLLFVAFY